MTYCALLFLFTCYRLAHVEEEVVGRAGRGVIISRSGGGGGVCMFSAREKNVWMWVVGVMSWL